MVLRLVYHSLYHWVSGHCLLVFQTEHFGNWICFNPKWVQFPKCCVLFRILDRWTSGDKYFIKIFSVWELLLYSELSRYYRVLTMVYNTQRYWVFGFCPSSRFFLNNNEKTQRFGNWICFRPQVLFRKNPDDGQSPKTQYLWVNLVVSVHDHLFNLRWRYNRHCTIWLNLSLL
jgi:hypothetical protein